MSLAANRMPLRRDMLEACKRERRALLLRGGLSGKQLALVGLILPLVRIGWRLALAGNSRPLSGIGRVGFGPSRRAVVAIGDDRLGRALRFAHAAINALAGVDHEHVFTGVEAVNWADFDAVHVFAANAVLGDHIGHGRQCPCLVGKADPHTGVSVWVIKGKSLAVQSVFRIGSIATFYWSPAPSAF